MALNCTGQESLLAPFKRICQDGGVKSLYRGLDSVLYAIPNNVLLVGTYAEWPLTHRLGRWSSTRASAAAPTPLALPIRSRGPPLGERPQVWLRNY